MFIGHYALAFAAKRFAPQTSLGVLVAAVSLPDLLWPIFLLLDWEQVLFMPGATRFTPLDFVSYPISHGLVATFGWATLFAALYFILTKYFRGSLVVWLAVLSHWLLDLVTHRPDMPLYANSRRYGLSLWNYPRATIIVESALFLAGIWLYYRTTRAKNRIGEFAFWGFAIVLTAFYVANIFSPPPPTMKVMAYAALGFGTLLILWAWWFDRHRVGAGT